MYFCEACGGPTSIRDDGYNSKCKRCRDREDEKLKPKPTPTSSWRTATCGECGWVCVARGLSTRQPLDYGHCRKIWPCEGPRNTVGQVYLDSPACPAFEGRDE